jgi:hypothetical protein
MDPNAWFPFKSMPTLGKQFNVAFVFNNLCVGQIFFRAPKRVYNVQASHHDAAHHAHPNTLYRLLLQVYGIQKMNAKKNIHTLGPLSSFIIKTWFLGGSSPVAGQGNRKPGACFNPIPLD